MLVTGFSAGRLFSKHTLQARFKYYIDYSLVLAKFNVNYITLKQLSIQKYRLVDLITLLKIEIK